MPPRQGRRGQGRRPPHTTVNHGRAHVCPISHIFTTSAEYPYHHTGASWTSFTPGNCNCGWPRLADYGGNVYNTPALCGALCAATTGCRAFGIWTGVDAGQCSLFDTVCTSPCATPTATAGGYTNDVFNMAFGILLLSLQGKGAGERTKGSD